MAHAFTQIKELIMEFYSCRYPSVYVLDCVIMPEIIWNSMSIVCFVPYFIKVITQVLSRERFLDILVIKEIQIMSNNLLHIYRY